MLAATRARSQALYAEPRVVGDAAAAMPGPAVVAVSGLCKSVAFFLRGGARFEPRGFVPCRRIDSFGGARRCAGQEKHEGGLKKIISSREKQAGPRTARNDPSKFLTAVRSSQIRAASGQRAAP